MVIWNVIRRCNLTCRHCYSLSNDTDFKGELSTEEALAVLDQLKAARVPAVIFSGGEPLLRPDLPVLLRRAKALGMHVSVSSNGTLLEAEMAATLADCGVDYYGVSLDGLAPTHDVFRRLEGAFDAALRGVRLARDSGIKTGIRMTLTEANADQLPAVVALMEAEGLDKIFTEAGFEWREPGCSMCLAMNADRLSPGERCASTSNRNFEGRQGPGGRTHLVSPAMAAAAAIAGHFVDIRQS